MRIYSCRHYVVAGIIHLTSRGRSRITSESSACGRKQERVHASSHLEQTKSGRYACVVEIDKVSRFLL